MLSYNKKMESNRLTDYGYSFLSHTDEPSTFHKCNCSL